jgi:uncharacterized protein (TIGR03435 family)
MKRTFVPIGSIILLQGLTFGQAPAPLPAFDVADVHVIANGYVDHVAVDMTGLKGGYDFTITWTPSGITRGNQPRPGDPAQPGVASDPSGGITFFDAVDKQLGLHLEGGQKHPMPVIVIDHIEPLGPEN